MCKAIQAARTTDEVLKIHDQARAMAAAAKVARAAEPLANLTEIMRRAVFKLADMWKAQKEAGLLAKGARAKGTKRKGLRGVIVTPRKEITFEEAGITKELAKQIRAAAPKSAKEREDDIAKRRRLAEAMASGTSAVIKEARHENLAQKRARRDANEERLGKLQRALPEEKFGVILADPPWYYEPYSIERTTSNPTHHYPTMDIESIRKLDVASLAADDCALFLWATIPLLDQQIDLLKHWGFTYKSIAIWDKEHAGTGYWFRGRHEMLLLGIKGKPPAPAFGMQWESIFTGRPATRSTRRNRMRFMS